MSKIFQEYEYNFNLTVWCGKVVFQKEKVSNKKPQFYKTTPRREKI